MLLWEVLLIPGDFGATGVTGKSVSRKGKGFSSRKRLSSTQTAVSCHIREKSCKGKRASNTEWLQLQHPLQNLEHRKVFQLMMQELWAGLEIDIRRKLKSSIGGSCLWCRGEGWIWLDDLVRKRGASHDSKIRRSRRKGQKHRERGSLAKQEGSQSLCGS